MPASTRPRVKTPILFLWISASQKAPNAAAPSSPPCLLPALVRPAIALTTAAAAHPRATEIAADRAATVVVVSLTIVLLVLVADIPSAPGMGRIAEEDTTIPVLLVIVGATVEIVVEIVEIGVDSVVETEETVGASEETVGASEETVGASEETVGASEETVGASEETVGAS